MQRAFWEIAVVIWMYSLKWFLFLWSWFLNIRFCKSFYLLLITLSPKIFQNIPFFLEFIEKNKIYFFKLKRRKDINKWIISQTTKWVLLSFWFNECEYWMSRSWNVIPLKSTDCQLNIIKFALKSSLWWLLSIKNASFV